MAQETSVSCRKDACTEALRFFTGAMSRTVCAVFIMGGSTMCAATSSTYPTRQKETFIKGKFASSLIRA
jgi:hypothetical protein